MFDLLLLLLQTELLGLGGCHHLGGEVVVVFLVVLDGLGGRQHGVFLLEGDVGPDQVAGE